MLPSDLAMLKRNEVNGGYKVYLWDSGSGTAPSTIPTGTTQTQPSRNSTASRSSGGPVPCHQQQRIQRMLFFNLGELQPVPSARRPSSSTGPKKARALQAVARCLC